MSDLLKKFGVPSIIAAVVSALIAILPLMFKIDERYAKEEDVSDKIEVLSKQIQDLSIEVGQLAGSQQVLVAVIASNNAETESSKPRIVSRPTRITSATPKPVTVEDAGPTASTLEIKTAAERQEKLKSVYKSLELTQQRVQEIAK